MCPITSFAMVPRDCDEAKIALHANTCAVLRCKFDSQTELTHRHLMLLLRTPLALCSRPQVRRVMVSSSLGGIDNKRKMVKIGTHSGSFHCDEALGCFLLRQTDAFRDADIVRTRDENVLSELDVVIDVGGKYDPGI